MSQTSTIYRAFVCALVAGCDEPLEFLPPDEFVGETRDLHAYRDPSGEKVCAGTLVVWQTHVEAVGSFLGATQSLGPFAVVITGSSGAPLYCDGRMDRAGCANGKAAPPFAVGDAWAIPHELAHLVEYARSRTDRTPFWSEGFAEAWSDRGSELPSAAALDSLLVEDSREVDYPLASHWVQWIAGEHGSEAIAAFLRVSERKDKEQERVDIFEEVLGEPYTAVQERFWSEAALYYPGFGRCGETDHVLPARGRLNIGVTIDCAVDPGPMPAWPEGRVYTTRVIEIAESAMYRIHADRGSALLLPCDAIDDPLDASRWSNYERKIYYEGTDAVPTQLGLRAGRYKLWLVSTDELPIDMNVVIVPWVPLTRVVP